MELLPDELIIKICEFVGFSPACFLVSSGNHIMALRWTSRRFAFLADLHYLALVDWFGRGRYSSMNITCASTGPAYFYYQGRFSGYTHDGRPGDEVSAAVYGKGWRYYVGTEKYRSEDNEGSGHIFSDMIEAAMAETALGREVMTRAAESAKLIISRTPFPALVLKSAAEIMDMFEVKREPSPEEILIATYGERRARILIRILPAPRGEPAH